MGNRCAQLLVEEHIRHFEEAKYEIGAIQATAANIRVKSKDSRVAAVNYFLGQVLDKNNCTQFFQAVGNGFNFRGDLKFKNI